MKTLHVFIVTLFFINLSAQQPKEVEYNQWKSKAMIAVVKANYKKAFDYYKKAFALKRPNNDDFRNAINVELILNKGKNKERVFSYLKQVRQYLWGVDTKKAFEVINMMYPEVTQLEYYNELLPFLETIKVEKQSIIQKKQSIDDQFKEILRTDQEVRQEYEYGSDLFELNVNRTDSINIILLNKAIRDTSWNMNNCRHCLIAIETVITHAASCGDTTWINPLRNALNQGQLDHYKFAAIIDYASLRMGNDYLAKQGLFFNTFTGIRLCDCMAFTQSKNKSYRKLAKRNRKKYGLMPLKDEETLVLWQFSNSDIINFIPYKEMLWCSGEENEEEKIMLEEEKMSTIEFLSQKNKVIIKTK